MASLFIELAAAGLVGVECYYSEHSAELTKEYLAMAKQANLVPTGGSDFHGKVSTGIRLGVGFGGLNVPDEALAQLEERCRAPFFRRVETFFPWCGKIRKKFSTVWKPSCHLLQ